MLIFAIVNKPSVTVSVSNDLVTDQRVSKVCDSLVKFGFDVKLIGRKLPDSAQLNRNYKTLRFNFLFNKGPLFYLSLNIRIFIYLLFSKRTILLSNDLDTLPANFFVSKIRGFKLVYDSHELFSEVPELLDRPFIQNIWRRIESYFLPKLEVCYTVSAHIARYYDKLYSTNFKLIRNFPIQKDQIESSRSNYIIYQGALNIGRGIEDIIRAMPYIQDYNLVIAGSGDVEIELKKIVNDLNLSDKVRFLGRLTPLELSKYTSKAKLGLSLEEDLGLNYRFAVPNKIFDYIQNEVPILFSPLVEVMELLEPFSVGEVLKSRDPHQLAEQINDMLSSEKYKDWVEDCKKAKTIFNWKTEEQKLKEIFDSIA